MEHESIHFDSELTRLMEEKPKVVDAAKNLLAQIMATNSPDVSAFSQQELLQGIQRVLKSVRNLKMMHPVEYFNANPQLDSQSGVARIEQVMHYKAAYTLHLQAQNKQQSSCKLLGKSFLVLVWPQIEQNLKPSSADDAIQFLLQEFARSFNEQDELVWAQDMHAIFAQRQQTRVEQAKLRLEEEEAMMKDQLKNALTTGSHQEKEEEARS